MGILKKEFPGHQNWIKKFKVLFDLGFISVGKLYLFKELVIGEKREKNQDKTLHRN